MKTLMSSAAAAALIFASPSQAQDWLGGIARSLGAAAAEAVVNRAVGAATTATRDALTPGTPVASAQQGGRPEMYDGNGDRLYRPRPSDRNIEPFRDKAIWRSAAYCAALTQLVDIHIADWKARYAKNKAEYPQSNIDSDYQLAAGRAEKFRKLAMLRMQIDHPTHDWNSPFDTEVARVVPDLRQQTWTPEMTWNRKAEECESFYGALSGLMYNMENRRGEGSQGAPR